MLRKSLIAFMATTVVCAGSQAVAAGVRHAMSTPRTPFPRSEEKVLPISRHAEIPIAELDRKDLLGKKMYDHQGNFLGKVVSVIKDDAGEIVSVQLRATVTREARVPANQVNIKPDGGTLMLAEFEQGAAMELYWAAGPITGPPPPPTTIVRLSSSCDAWHPGASPPSYARLLERPAS